MKSQIKVVHVIDALGPGGCEKLLETTLPAMREQSVECAVIYLNDEQDCLAGLTASGIPSLCLRPGQPKGFRPFRRTPLTKARDASLAGEFAGRFGANLIHAHLLRSYLFVPDLHRALGSPYVVTEHSAGEAWQTFQNFSARNVRRKVIQTFRHAGKVICVSPGAEGYLKRDMGLADLDTAVVTNAISDEFWQPAPTVAPVGDFLMTGRLNHEKNHLFALEAFSRLAATVPNFKATIAGSGTRESEIRAAVDRLNLQNNVSLVGWKSQVEVRDLLDRHSVLFMPSTHEGLGLSAVEALARGIRVVLSDIEVFRTSFSQYEGVELVPLDDPELAARALARAIRQPRVERPALKQAYSIAAHTENMRVVYDQVLGPRA